MKTQNIIGIQTFVIMFLLVFMFGMYQAFDFKERIYLATIDNQTEFISNQDDRTNRVMTIADHLQKKNKFISPVTADHWAESIQTASELYRIDTRVLLALYHVESRALHYGREGFITTSLAGAGGIGQIMYDIWYKACPFSKKREDLRNGATNILCSAFILRTYLDENNDNMELALTSYNGGPNGVRLYLRGIDITDGYAKQVLMRV